MHVPRTCSKNIRRRNHAPNHYRVRPWRFFVLSGGARNKLGDVMAASQLDRMPDAPKEALDNIRALPLRAPVIITVGVDKPVEKKVIGEENIAAVSAACQNILLAAHSLGLGAIWRTHEWARDAKVKEFFGLAEDQTISGVHIYRIPRDRHRIGSKTFF
ncbi:MAG: nitroreductase [Anaerolineales bacterium]|nr:nitroreductase [Anaerolineales bacterium]